MATLQQPQFESDKIDRPWLERVGFRTVADVLAYTPEEIVAVTRSSDVFRLPVGTDLGGPAEVFVKRYYYARRDQRIKQMFRGTLFGKSRARTEYEFLREMRRRDVPTVRPIAYGDRRSGMFLHASFIITEGCPRSRSLDVFALDRDPANALNRLQRTRFTVDLADTIRRMHHAGVRHGGLFWRNILVQSLPDSRFGFVLLDPDTHARLHETPIPQEDASGDLSEFLASAIALGFRSGLSTFMKTYLQTQRLTHAHRQTIARIMDRARTLAIGEQQRMAITETVEWLTNRIATRRDQSKPTRSVESIDEFFDALAGARIETTSLPDEKRTIRFVFRDPTDSNGGSRRSVVLDQGRFTTTTNTAASPDMEIRTDAQTWLAIIAGKPDGLERVRAGRLRVQGDVRLLPLLVATIEA